MNEQLYQKIDGRHTGVGDWAYFTKLPPSWKSGRYSIDQIFYKHYAWCWETWGPSKIIHDWYNDIDRGVLKKDAFAHNEHWAYEMRLNGNRIFLRTDVELSLFLLKWR